MGSYLVVFFLAAAAAALGLPPFMRIGRRVGAVDNTRDPPIPRVGGWGIVFGVGAALLLVGVVFEPTGQTLAGERESFVAIAFGAVARSCLAWRRAANSSCSIYLDSSLGVQRTPEAMTMLWVVRTISPS